MDVERYITPEVQAIVREHAYGSDDALAALVAALVAVLPTILARHERDVGALAWDAGYSAAEMMARCYGHTDWWEDEPANPYRLADGALDGEKP